MKEYTITFTAEITDILTEDDLKDGFDLETAVAAGDTQASVRDILKDLMFVDVNIRDFKLFVQEAKIHEAED